MPIGGHNSTQLEALPGMADQGARTARAINKEGAALRFGTFVTFKTDDDRDGVEAADAQTDLCRGVLAYVAGDVAAGENSLGNDKLGHVVEDGRVCVLLDEGETPSRGDAVWVRTTVEGADTILGTARTDEDTDKAGLLANAYFDSEAFAGPDSVTCAWVMLGDVLQLSNP